MTHSKPQGRIVALLLTSALSMLMLAAGSSFLMANAVLIEPEQHWKYYINGWKWDPDIRKTHGIIEPQLIIQNETEGRIDGYVADSQGTRLDFYSGEQVVMARFGYDNGGVSKWEMVDRIEGGNFTIEIPLQHRQADNVQIYIGNNQYTVNDGTPTTPQTWVFVNSIRTNHDLNVTIHDPETVLAQASKPVAWETYSSDSLIDRILRMYSAS